MGNHRSGPGKRSKITRKQFDDMEYFYTAFTLQERLKVIDDYLIAYDEHAAGIVTKADRVVKEYVMGTKTVVNICKENNINVSLLYKDIDLLLKAFKYYHKNKSISDFER